MARGRPRRRHHAARERRCSRPRPGGSFNSLAKPVGSESRAFHRVSVPTIPFGPVAQLNPQAAGRRHCHRARPGRRAVRRASPGPRTGHRSRRVPSSPAPRGQRLPSLVRVARSDARRQRTQRSLCHQGGAATAAVSTPAYPLLSLSQLSVFLQRLKSGRGAHMQRLKLTPRLQQHQRRASKHTAHLASALRSASCRICFGLFCPLSYSAYSLAPCIPFLAEQTLSVRKQASRSGRNLKPAHDLRREICLSSFGSLYLCHCVLCDQTHMSTVLIQLLCICVCMYCCCIDGVCVCGCDLCLCFVRLWVVSTAV